jgi:putative hemolysin
MIVMREDGSWLVDAMMNFSDFAQAVRLIGEEEHDTVAGFVLAHLGRLPRVADHFTTAGFRVEIVDMDGHRVDRVLVSKVDAG